MWFLLLDDIHLYALCANNEINFQILASSLKEAVPRKAQPELVGEGSRGGKDSLGIPVKTVESSCGKGNGSLLMNKLDSVWGSILQLPSQQELIRPNTAGSSSPPCRGFGVGHGNKLPFLYRWTAGSVLNKVKDILYCHLKYLSYLFHRCGCACLENCMYVHDNLEYPYALLSVH